MGIMDWFKALAAAPASAPTDTVAEVKLDERGAEVGGLNFKSAIDAHMKWKVRLQAYINGTSEEDLRSEVICRDDQCPLGKWIYSQGIGKFGYSETFFDMKAHHAHFHRCAADVLIKAQAGEKTQALHLLHSGDYLRASERVKTLLAKLFVLVADGNAAIDAHVKWKARLQAYIEGTSQEALTTEAIARDDDCSLGHWLNGAGRDLYGHLPQFEEVRSLHVRFHRCAADVLATAQSGDREEALRRLDEGDYAQASTDVVAALLELFTQQPRSA